MHFKLKKKNRDKKLGVICYFILKKNMDQIGTLSQSDNAIESLK